MAKELLVNVSRGEEVRVSLVEDGRLEEIYLERDSAASNVGNIYLGKVTNVESSIQAAFVDFGYGRNGFLHVQDLHPDYFPEGGRWDRMQERVGKKIGRRDRPPIQDCLRRGDQIVVQIIKEGIGTKGPTLTSYPSIPGRFLVMMPGVAQMGVSKNIEDEAERSRLRKILDGLKPPKEVGFIIRTAGMGKTKTELERDFKYLTRLHEQIETHKKQARPPALLYSEGDLVTRTVRDVWSSDVDRVVCDDPETALRIKQFFKLLMPRTKVSVQLYQGSVPLFHAAGIEQEIETMFSRHVPLPSGGSLVIDSTEAAVAVDVNSGKFREHADAEETAFRTDMEAADEICRQLRLRDLGGVVIVDFIDLRYSRHRQALHDRLTDLFKQDKAKSRHLPMNEFGIVAVTRQRMRPDLKKSVFMSCPWSHGTGYIKTPESMALDVMRRLRVAAADPRVTAITVRLYPTVALHVLNTKRQALADLERQSETLITLRQDETLASDDIVLELTDERGGQVLVEALQPASKAVAVSEMGGRRRRRRRRPRPEGPQLPAEQPLTAQAGAGKLIELPELLELGELRLEEVEKLVNELGAEETAAREAAKKDPQRIILEALRSGALFDDELQAQPVAETAAAGAAPGKARGEQGGRGRRRRGRDRGGEARDGRAHEEAAPPEVVEEPTQTTAKPEVDAQPQKVTTVGGQHPSEVHGARRQAEDEGDRRRRRRRGRRGRGGAREGDEGRAPAQVAQTSEAGADEAADEGFSAASAEGLTADEVLDARVNGNRSDRQTHSLIRDPFTQGGLDVTPTGEIERPRRRRRKGRGLRGHLVAGYGSPAPAEIRPEARLGGAPRNNGWRSGPAALLGGVAQAVARPDENADGGRRRRRRRRGRRESQERPVAGAGQQLGDLASEQTGQGESQPGWSASPERPDSDPTMQSHAGAPGEVVSTASSAEVAEALEAGTVGSALKPDAAANRPRRSAKAGGRRRPRKKGSATP